MFKKNLSKPNDVFNFGGDEYYEIYIQKKCLKCLCLLCAKHSQTIFVSVLRNWVGKKRFSIYLWIDSENNKHLNSKSLAAFVGENVNITTLLGVKIQKSEKTVEAMIPLTTYSHVFLLVKCVFHLRMYIPFSL